MTLRELIMSNSDEVALKTLKQLNIGLAIDACGYWASNWSLGYHEPTIEDIQELRDLIKRNSAGFGNVDCELPL